MRLTTTLLILSVAAGTAAVHAEAARADQARGANPAAARACSLLTKAEVKPFVGGNNPFFDQTEPEENAIGTGGSGCNYAGVHIQVNPFTSARLEDLRKTTGKAWAAVSGVGDAAYFQNRSGDYAELYARRGAHVVTVQMDVPAGQTPESVRPATVGLARALLAKLP